MSASLFQLITDTGIALSNVGKLLKDSRKTILVCSMSYEIFSLVDNSLQLQVHFFKSNRAGPLPLISLVLGSWHYTVCHGKSVPVLNFR